MTRFGFVRSAITREHAWWYGSAVTVACVALATGLRWALGSAASGVPFVTYFPAIMVCALLAGWRYGMAATLLSIAAVNFLFFKPYFAFAADGRSALMALFFLVSCALLIAVAQTLRRTFLELERTNAHVGLLNRELRHRLRNTLAVVQALAEQTARSRPDDFIPALTSRLHALAQAHDVLSQADEQSCDLQTIVSRACAPFGEGDTIAYEGPTCRLARDMCVPLSLALHELCTNAVKHGALSQPGGRVFISWERDDAGPAQLVWEEAGGPPVFPPKRKGLGTILLTSQPELGGSRLEFHPRGLRCSFELACLGDSPGQ